MDAVEAKKEKQTPDPWDAFPSVASFEQVLLREPCIREALRRGLSLEDVIVLLVNQRNLITKKLLDVQSYAPKKMILEDGRVMLWQCPAELVPVQEDLRGKDALGGQTTDRSVYRTTGGEPS